MVAPQTILMITETLGPLMEAMKTEVEDKEDSSTRGLMIQNLGLMEKGGTMTTTTSEGLDKLTKGIKITQVEQEAEEAEVEETTKEEEEVSVEENEETMMAEEEVSVEEDEETLMAEEEASVEEDEETLMVEEEASVEEVEEVLMVEGGEEALISAKELRAKIVGEFLILLKMTKKQLKPPKET